mmetsp:Transcript_13930/g.46128  ORF Transcript_13930/g.46128 Transcript_13930/m.46128 type:complete len:258 (-) Transcript_13930:831-1604(-)
MRALTSTCFASSTVFTNLLVGSCDNTSISSSKHRSQNKILSQSKSPSTTASRAARKKSSISRGNHLASVVSFNGTGAGFPSFAAAFSALACFFCKCLQCLSSPGCFPSSNFKRVSLKPDHSGSDTNGNAQTRTFSCSRLWKARTRNMTTEVFSTTLNLSLCGLSSPPIPESRLNRRMTFLKKPSNFSSSASLSKKTHASNPCRNFSFTIATIDTACFTELFVGSKCGHRNFSRYWLISRACVICRFSGDVPPPSSES